MEKLGIEGRSAVIPGMQYRDAVAAMEWLTAALGFERQAVYEGPDGTILHAQMTFGDGMIMLGSAAKESEYSALVALPDEIGGREARSVSLVAVDCDAVYARAKAAGAEMVFDLEEKPYGGKGFTCRDPEGYLWHVGSYNPWAAD